MKSKLNVKLIRRIQKHITEEPRRFMMSWFEVHGQPGTSEWENIPFNLYDISKTVPDCGTAACLLGWTNALTGGLKGDWDNTERACRELGIEYEDSVRIYGYPGDCWPKPFGKRYIAARTPKTRAKIACERLDYLIKTGE